MRVSKVIFFCSRQSVSCHSNTDLITMPVCFSVLLGQLHVLITESLDLGLLLGRVRDEWEKRFDMLLMLLKLDCKLKVTSQTTSLEV